MTQVGDQSDYVGQLSAVFAAAIPTLSSCITESKYFKNCLDKIVE